MKSPSNVSIEPDAEVGPQCFRVPLMSCHVSSERAIVVLHDTMREGGTHRPTALVFPGFTAINRMAGPLAEEQTGPRIVSCRVVACRVWQLVGPSPSPACP